MRVAITGAAGFLARHIIEELAEDFELTLGDIAAAPKDLPANCRWTHCDVTQPASVAELVKGQDAVVHTVALVREATKTGVSTFVDVVVGGTWNTLAAAVDAGVSRFVNISSIVVMGGPIASGAGDPIDHPITVHERHPIGPRGLSYVLSKTLGETVADVYARTYPNLSVLNLRPGVITGDGQNSDPAPPADNTRRHWFVHVDPKDVARAVRRGLSLDPAPRGSYNILASRPDAMYSWAETERDLHFVTENTWPQIK
ncbi:hypothetical protein AXK11_09035 [Cephaloticoccus primus]|uniref:NAD-dependent epimerase/dehydratase domain-containing protein n=1 Tax=Cephaloticoccus primus TaxID=1548207 RepID=A0A139SHL8_9BACT|nr:NAD(P)-dependent oxidoreductase [Cephaloticoccus primus]KXU34065.1 hypothetical protein AXK11_09035 [Cephaloticoccus primus]